MFRGLIKESVDCVEQLADDIPRADPAEVFTTLSLGLLKRLAPAGDWFVLVFH